MRHFIRQFCHANSIQSQLVRMRKKQHFSQSLPRGELRTMCRFALAHTVAEICTTSFVNFVILICMLKVIKFIQSQLVRMRKKQYFSQSLPRGELTAICRFALAHTVTEICTTSFVNFVILIVCAIINSLGTALFCCKFNHVDTDQFSCEYLV